MKKIFSFVAVLFLAISTFAMSAPSSSAPKPKPVLAKDIMIPVGKDGKKISLLDLSNMSKKELEQFTGRKMNFAQSVAFKGAQKKLRNNISDEGVVSAKMQKYFYDGETGFNLGGFALGFLFGLIGVLVAYLINDEKKSNRRKWAWLGLATALVLTLIIVVAII